MEKLLITVAFSRHAIMRPGKKMQFATSHMLTSKGDICGPP
jgi:hypothetical protein